MKKILTLLILSALALSLFGCGKEVDQPAAETVLPVEGLNSLTYYNGTTTLRFSKTDNTWVWTDGTDFPLNDSTIQAITEQLPNLLSLPGTAPGEDLSEYGLAAPSRYLTAVSGGDSTTLYFGSQTDAGTWYMCTDEATQIYQVEDSFIQLLDHNIYDMAILPSMPNWTADTVQSVSIARGEETPLTLTLTDGVWKKSGKDVTAKVSLLLDILNAIAPSRCIDYAPADGAADICGLAEPTATVTVKYTNSINADSSFSIVIGSVLEDQSGYCVTLGESHAIYCIDTELLEPLLALMDGHV